jgi:streptogramin lyase
MKKQAHTRAIIVVLTVLSILWFQPTGAQENNASLRGVVKNSSGTPISGAFVKLKNSERRLTFMVVTQAQGRYSASHLPPGKYVAQAIGGDYQSEPSKPIEVSAGRAASAELALTVMRQPQLLPAWPGRPPGERGGEAEAATGREAPALPDGEGKKIVEAKCLACHDAQRTVRARADRKRWQDIVRNMRLYAQGSTLAKDLTDQEEKTLVDYLAANFSGSRGGASRPKPDPNSRLPRILQAAGAAKYVAVEYELPNPNSEPHEVTVDTDGNGWVSQRVGGHLGRFDPKTLIYAEIPPPAAPSDFLRLNGIRRGPDNKVWLVDGGPNRRWMSYDTRKKEFTVYELPKTATGNASGNTLRVHPNGTVWMNSIAANQVIRLDPATRQFTFFDVPAGVKAGRTANPYGMAIAGDGAIWIAENSVNQVARIDPVTGKFDEFEIPVKDSVPRKLGADGEGNIWVGLHGAGKLMKIDYKTNKMTVYTPPSDDAGLYLADVDMKRNLIWVSLQHVDKIARFDPKTETWQEFPLATAESDARRIEVDPKNPNRVWWSGNLSNRMGYIELLK